LSYILHRNVLTRGLGLQDDVEIDLFEIDDIKCGDQFLLCSDGLYDVVTEAEIESRLRTQGAAQGEVLDYFIDLARSRGAPDNVTVVLVRVEPDDGDSESGSEVADDMPKERGKGGGPPLGFVPPTVFAPISYFLVFALGVGTALLFEDNTASSAQQSSRALPSTAVHVLDHPLGAEFVRDQARESSDAKSVRVDVDAFLRWLKEHEVR
jgi:hypothetical protein